MESIDKYFIVTRGKARKGISRGCIGRIEAETQTGEILGVICGNGGGTSKSGGLLKREETYPLTRHQAQLLMFVSPASRRLEILCNQTLFRAICDLAQDDLVVVRYKKGFQPCLVKNLMQIGRKDGSDDLNMLGFELQPVVCSLVVIFFNILFQIIKSKKRQKRRKKAIRVHCYSLLVA